MDEDKKNNEENKQEDANNSPIDDKELEEIYKLLDDINPNDEANEELKEEIKQVFNDIVKSKKDIKEDKNNNKEKPKKKSKHKIIIIKTRLFENIIFETLFNIILNFIILFAINTILSPIICEIWVLLVLVSIYLVLNKTLRYFMNKHFYKVIFKSLGLILILGDLICLTLSNLLLYEIRLLSYYNLGLAIIYFILMMLVSHFIEFYLIRIRTRFPKKKGKKK